MAPEYASATARGRSPLSEADYNWALKEIDCHSKSPSYRRSSGARQKSKHSTETEIDRLRWLHRLTQEGPGQVGS